MKKEFATIYSHPISAKLCFEPGTTRTRQEFAAESDVNRLVARYQETGSFYDPIVSLKAAARKPMFGDFTNVPDYQTALNKVIEAQDLFSRLPSKTRDRFENDPQKLLAFLQDAANRDEAISLGLIPKPVEAPSRSAEEKPSEEKPPDAAK